MAGTKSGKRVGIWLKLLLWGVVILAAFFYLRSINEKASEGKLVAGIDHSAKTVTVESTSTGAAETAPAAPIEPAASPEIDVEGGGRPQPSVSQDEQPAPEPEQSAVVQSGVPGISAVGSAESTGTKSPQKAEPTALPTETAATAQQTGSSAAVAEEPSVTRRGSPASGAAEIDSAAPDAPETSPEVSLSAAAAPVAPSLSNERKAQGEGVADAGAQLGTRGAGRAPVPLSPQASAQSDDKKGRSAPESTVPGSVLLQPPVSGLSASPKAPTTDTVAATTGSAPKSFEQQRARIIAEYQALRRERWELMREYWQYMGAPGRRPMGPPGYYPGYAPWHYRPWQKD